MVERASLAFFDVTPLRCILNIFSKDIQGPHQGAAHDSPCFDPSLVSHLSLKKLYIPFSSRDDGRKVLSRKFEPDPTYTQVTIMDREVALMLDV